MFLISKKDQSINVAGAVIRLKAGEKIHTENSHKYTVGEVITMAEAAGFTYSRVWQDDQELFGVFYLYS